LEDDAKFAARAFPQNLQLFVGGSVAFPLILTFSLGEKEQPLAGFIKPAS
jgi:hypothetical protein